MIYSQDAAKKERQMAQRAVFSYLYGFPSITEPIPLPATEMRRSLIREIYERNGVDMQVGKIP